MGKISRKIFKFIKGICMNQFNLSISIVLYDNDFEQIERILKNVLNIFRDFM